MKKHLFLFLFILFTVYHISAQENALFTTPFETSKGMASATWDQAIKYYKNLVAAYPTLRMENIGNADGGYPLHIIYFSAQGDYNKEHWRKDGKLVILINNAIHPGEPDGVDA